MVSLCAPAQNYWKARACFIISLFCIRLYRQNIKKMMHDLKDYSDTFSGLENILNRHKKKINKVNISTTFLRDLLGKYNNQ